MENKITVLEDLKLKGKDLRISYFKETDTKKAGQILKRRADTMDKIHVVQNQINQYLFDNLSA